MSGHGVEGAGHLSVDALISGQVHHLRKPTHGKLGAVHIVDNRSGIAQRFARASLTLVDTVNLDSYPSNTIYFLITSWLRVPYVARDFRETFTRPFYT